jgi:hypothetical protein
VSTERLQALKSSGEQKMGKQRALNGLSNEANLKWK